MRSRTCSTSVWSPSATPHTTASSGSSMQRDRGLRDHLVHGPRLGHRLLERAPVRLEHRPDHRPGHRPGRHRPGQDQQHDAGDDERHAQDDRAIGREVEAGDEGDDPGDDRERAAPGPPPRRGRGRLAEPALVDDVPLELLVELADARAKLQHVVGLDVAAAGRRSTSAAGRGTRWPGRRAAIGHGRAGTAPADRGGAPCPAARAAAGRRTRRHRRTRGPRRWSRCPASCSSRADPTSRPGTRSARARRGRGSRRSGPGGSTGRRGRPHPRPVSGPGRRGEVDRRVVEVDRVAPVAEPAGEAPQDDPRPTSGATSNPRIALRSRKKLSWAACSGVAAASTLAIAASSEPSMSHPRRSGSMSLVEDRLALLVGQELRAIPGPGVELDLAVARVALVRSYRITSPSSKPLRPTPHWSMSAIGALLRVLGRLAAGHDLGVDDDLGAGPLLDRRRSSTRPAERPSGRTPRRCRRPPAVVGIRERRPGGGDGRRGGEADERGEAEGGARDASQAPTRGGGGSHGRTIPARQGRVATTATGWRARIRRTSSAACS